MGAIGELNKLETTMKCKTHMAFLFVIFSVVACNNANEKGADEIRAVSGNITAPQTKNQTKTIDTDSIIAKLQGAWKEPEYPFRVAHFKDTTVKFIEEGVIEPPAFKEFKISRHCSFRVNNLKNAKPADVFLVLPEAKACDIITVSNDTLTLSGFNVSSNENYRIVYAKVE